MKNKHDVLDAVLDALSNVSGETKEEINKILESAKSNLEKLNNCKLHRFGKIKYKSGYNYQCLNCGGKNDSLTYTNIRKRIRSDR